MKILKHGKPPLRKLFFDCFNCGCSFEASEDECGDLPGDRSYIWCECPECRARTGAVLQDTVGDIVRPRFKKEISGSIWFLCPTCGCDFEFYKCIKPECPECGQKFIYR